MENLVKTIEICKDMKHLIKIRTKQNKLNLLIIEEVERLTAKHKIESSIVYNILGITKQIDFHDQDSPSYSESIKIPDLLTGNV